jgi:hypothetical protein
VSIGRTAPGIDSGRRRDSKLATNLEKSSKKPEDPRKSALIASLLWILACVMGIPGCASKPPSQVENLCGIFYEKRGFFEDWHQSARQASHKYGVPIPTLMATIHQESRFRPKARPPRRKLLWFIPWRRPSSAYGFAQAKDETWDYYMRKSGNRGADRDRFEDAVDFVGWYHHTTKRRNGVPTSDTYNLYLAYHEGNGGFERRTYARKPWLQKVAKKVDRRAQVYARQYAQCQPRLSR